jgi:hypothetical protein
MNERIENLMLDATKDMPQGYYVPGVYFEKFAELIVRECIQFVGDADSLKVKQMKKHFGV